jgi:hypothetical protein
MHIVRVEERAVVADLVRGPPSLQEVEHVVENAAPPLPWDAGGALVAHPFKPEPTSSRPSLSTSSVVSACARCTGLQYGAFSVLELSRTRRAAEAATVQVSSGSAARVDSARYGCDGPGYGSLGVTGIISRSLTHWLS